MPDSRRLLIFNIAKIVSGRLDHPLLDADTILVEDGKITRVGKREEIQQRDSDTLVDANGQIVIPGLIDSHFHPAIGDWSPRFRTVGYLESILHSGVTTVISQGELHIAGRPRDVKGIKALALLAKKTYENYKPYGLKIHAGTLLLDALLREEDFKELAEEGIRIVPEIGATSIHDREQLSRMVALAKNYGMIITIHCGGKSIPGSKTVTLKDITELDPHIIAHINGGPVSPPLEDIKQMFTETSAILEIVYGGNLHTAIEAARLAKSQHALGRVILGNDAPTSSAGLGTLGIIRLTALLSSAAGIPGAEAIALATGNAAKAFRLTAGTLEAGKDADLVIMDNPEGSSGTDAIECLELGDTPAISAVIVDGKLVCLNSRFTPASQRNVRVNGVEKPQPSFEEYIFGYPKI